VTVVFRIFDGKINHVKIANRGVKFFIEDKFFKSIDDLIRKLKE